MSNAETTPPPKSTSALWRWIKRIGCALLAVLLTCCGLTCTGGWLIQRSLHNMNKDEVDRFHAQGLQGGDVKAMHERADPAFRQKVSLDDLRAFLDAHPGLLERDNLHGFSLARRTIGGVEYIKVNNPGGLFDTSVAIVCKVVDDALVLVGISPGLDDLVPESFKHRSGSSRRHRHH